ncbi:MAG: substrate-binding domain-containing protein [Syntrophaceae bacterium]
MKRALWTALLSAAAVFLLFGYSPAQQNKPAGATLAAPFDVVETGVLQFLLSEYQKQTGGSAALLPLGSGAYLKIEKSEADLLLSDSPLFIGKFIRDGLGRSRVPLLRSELVLLGPADDRAGVRKLKSILEAFRRIAATQSPYVSRGDGSGINVRESDLWKEAGVNTSGQKWFLISGRPMAGTLEIASAKRAYVLTDRANYIAWRNRNSLEPFVAGDPLLLHLYEIVDIVPQDGNLSESARALLDFLSSEKARDLIRQYGKDRYSTPLYSRP